MEAQKAPNTTGREKPARSDASQINPDFSSSAEGRDPIYPNQSPSNLTSKGHLGDTMEGFKPQSPNDVGIPNLENTENFGSRFQMPEASTSDNFLTDPRPSDAGVPAPVGYDLQSSLVKIQDLILKIRANLDNPEQGELEALLREGAEVLSSHWAQLSQFAGTQVGDIKREIKDNPYASLISAIKIGMAISQVYTTRNRSVDSTPV